MEIVRTLLEGFARRDHERAFDFYDPNIEWDASSGADINADIAGVYHGHDGVRAYWRAWLSAWRDLDFELQDVLDAGDEVVALIRNQRQWGRHSGIQTEMPPYALVFTIRNGKVVRWRSFSDQESALKAVGLEEYRVSDENVEVLRRAMEAFDSEGFDGLTEFWHPDINWRAMRGAPDDVGVFTGHDAMRRYLDDWLEMFDDSRIEPEEFIDAGDRVVVMQHASGKSKRTGIPVDMRYAVVYTVQDGKIVRGREYATRDEALKAVGLEE